MSDVPNGQHVPPSHEATDVRAGQHVPADHVAHVRDVRQLHADVVARAREMAENPNVCTFCGEDLPPDVVARGAEFCDRTCEKRHRWVVIENRDTECRTCTRSLPDSVIQRRGRQCPACRRGETA